MQFFLTHSLRIPNRRETATAFSAMLVFAVVGCPMTEPGTDGDPTNTSDSGTLGQVSGEIVTLRNNQIVSALETSVAFFYSITGVPDEAVISAFFVSVADPGATVSEDDTRVIFQTNLLRGESQAFVFNPKNADTVCFINVNACIIFFGDFG